MPLFETTEKTPRMWRGKPTPPPGTPVNMTEDEAAYEVRLGILRRAKPKRKQGAPTEAPTTAEHKEDN